MYDAFPFSGEEICHLLVIMMHHSAKLNKNLITRSDDILNDTRTVSILDVQRLLDHSV